MASLGTWIDRQCSPASPACLAAPLPRVEQPTAALVHYLVVRADLPHGVQVAQVAHAAGESAGGPLPDGTIVVALATVDEPALRDLADQLIAHQVTHRLVIEDAGPHAGQATAIGIAPTRDRPKIRRLTSRLPLVR